MRRVSFTADDDMVELPLPLTENKVKGAPMSEPSSSDSNANPSNGEPREGDNVEEMKDKKFPDSHGAEGLFQFDSVLFVERFRQ
jgi:hypothetical protein